MLIGIFIPTKDRADKLESCLESCLKTKSHALKFIVLDNASDDNTTEVCSRYQGNYRFSYIRFSQQGNINDQFLRATQHSETLDWIAIIGDDDAVCAAGLDNLAEILIARNAEFSAISAITWDRPIFRWPDFAETERGMLSFTSHNTNTPFFLEDSRIYAPTETSRSVKIIYESPGIYHRLVRTTLVKSFLERYKEKVFFFSPDISFSAHASLETTQCAHLTFPVTLLGYSGKSTGAAFSGNDSREIREKFHQENPALLEEVSDYFSKKKIDKENHPPITEVLGTFLIINQVRESRSLSPLSMDVYIRSEIGNLHKISPEARRKFRRFVEYLAGNHGATIDENLIAACNSQEPPSSLGSIGTTLLTDGKTSVAGIRQTLRLPLDVVNTAAKAASLVESMVASLKKLTLR
jgi:hypothetical protein